MPRSAGEKEGPVAPGGSAATKAFKIICQYRVVILNKLVRQGTKMLIGPLHKSERGSEAAAKTNRPRRRLSLGPGPRGRPWAVRPVVAWQRGALKLLGRLLVSQS